MSQAVHPTGSAITGGEVETLFRRSNSSSGGGGDGGGTAAAIDGASSSSRIGSALAAAASAGGATARYTHAVDVAAELSEAQRFELERRASLQDDPKYHSHSGGEHGESSPLLMVGPFAWEAFSRLESEWPLILACFLVIGVIVLAVVVGGASGLTPCDYAVAHAFLVFPLDATCTRLLLSHGGEFQCPHQYDVKLLGSFDSTLDREQFCARYRAVGPPSSAAGRAAAAGGGGGAGPPVNFVVTPHMAAGGLRKLMGAGGGGVPGVAGWSSDLYEGVGASKVLLTAVGIRVDRVLWGQEYALRQRAPTLQYLFFPANDGGRGSGSGSGGVQRAGRAFASHVVTAPPDFDHLAFAVLNDTSLLRPLPGDSGPRLVSFPQLPNEVGARLRAGKTYEGAARVVGADGVPRMKPVQVTMEEQALYHGVSDEFVTYQRYCAAPDRPKWAVCS